MPTLPPSSTVQTELVKSGFRLASSAGLLGSLPHRTASRSVTIAFVARDPPELRAAFQIHLCGMWR